MYQLLPKGKKGCENMNEDLFESYPEILGVSDISRMLSVSKSKIYELIHNKEIKGFLIGRKFRVLKKEVIKFITSNSVA